MGSTLLLQLSLLAVSCFLLHALAVVSAAESHAAVKPAPPSLAPAMVPAGHRHHRRHHPKYHHHLAPAMAPAVHHMQPAPAPLHLRHHHHARSPLHHPPAHAPVHAPANAPVHAPFHAPPPYRPIPKHLPVRSLVAVQGVVYCKPCILSPKAPLGSPLPGATVKLHCRNTKYQLVVTTTTDKNGYFWINAPKTVTTYGAHRCVVSLVESPLAAKCGNPTDLNAGLNGALLLHQEAPVQPRPGEKFHAPLRALFSVGPFAFEPKCPR